MTLPTISATLATSLAPWKSADASKSCAVSSLTGVVAPKTIRRAFDLKDSSLRRSMNELAKGPLHVQSLGSDRWEICDPDLVEHQFWGPCVIAKLSPTRTGSRLELTLHQWMLPQLVRRQWAWNLGTSTLLSLAVAITAPSLLPWIVGVAFFGVLMTMTVASYWKARTQDVLTLGDITSDILAPIAHRQRRPPASGTPYRCLNSEIKAQAKRMRRAGRRRLRFVLPWRA